MSELWMEYRAYRKAKSRFNASLSRGAWAVEATRLNVVSDGEAQQLATRKQMRNNEQRAKQGRVKRFFKGALNDAVHSLRNNALRLVKGRSLEQLQATDEIVEDQKHWHKPHEVRLRKGKAGLGVRFALESCVSYRAVWPELTERVGSRGAGRWRPCRAVTARRIASLRRTGRRPRPPHQPQRPPRASVGRT